MNNTFKAIGAAETLSAGTVKPPDPFQGAIFCRKYRRHFYFGISNKNEFACVSICHILDRAGPVNGCCYVKL